MSFISHSSPHVKNISTSQNIMRHIICVLLLCILIQCWFFGWGVLINVVWSSIVALISEALIVKLRKRPVLPYLKDSSALVTAFLLAIALPPLLPWWMTLIGVSFAIIFGKQLYGGLGNNPFNPAMLGYVMLLISFPQEMTQWLPSQYSGEYLYSFKEIIYQIFAPKSAQEIDILCTATPLDIKKTNTLIESSNAFFKLNFFNSHVGKGWFWVNIAYLLGGLYLLRKKIFTWHAPVGMLASILTLSLIFGPLLGIEKQGTLFISLFSGATMLGAFFIITDPVSGATSPLGRLIFGSIVGVLTYIIRTWGGYPDAIAFATLLANISAPVIDYYTPMRTYGHMKSKKGIMNRE